MRPTALNTYEDWRTCIEVACGITLTPEFVARRIAELSDSGNYNTMRFVAICGEAHRLRVLAWFGEAKEKLRRAVNSSAVTARSI